ncbi:hypothetical protein Tco_1056404 [Tanacetum coccineum]|uniref:Integrase, catalytic region, zinc finger, CCHC-type, peptidase aspartic, catalytic n=1 Tax=Tanacetum coccineum TaxID=301880 RepID=A0ABQ5H468_9ASTR
MESDILKRIGGDSSQASNTHLVDPTLDRSLLPVKERLLAFCLKFVLRFVPRLGCVLPKTSCVLPSFEDLHCVLGKENGVNILKSIDEEPFQLGTFRETLAEGTECALHFGLERPRVYSDLTLDEKQRYNADIRATNILLQGLPKDIYSLINHYTDAKDIWDNIWDNIKMLLEGSELIKEDRGFVTAVKLNKGLKDSNYDQLYAYLKQHEANENKIMLERFSQHTVDPFALISNVVPQQSSTVDQVLQLQRYRPHSKELHSTQTSIELQIPQRHNVVDDLALNMDNVFQADDYDAFDSDVNEAPTAQTMFMANLSSADLVYDKAGLSYDSNILSKIHDDVQPIYVVDSHADYTSDSNMVPYDQYVKDNAVPVVQRNVSTFPNDAYMMIDNDMYEMNAQSASKTPRNTIVDNLLTTELATYKEQVKLYERRARFELMEREQKIDEQLRIVNTDRNIKEENLKKELHYVKLQLASTINHNKSMVNEVTSLKKDFKQKENKYLEEFLDMKALKEKVKIAQPDYSKENYLAIFTPQKQLTLEQIFWSYDLIKMKAEALKNQTTVSRPIIDDGIQTALTKEVKEMKFFFEELEAEVDQNAVHRKHDGIMRKNLLIANDNLIAECLSKDVFYIETNSKLNVARFTDMHDAHTVVQARCLALEAELFKLRDKVQNDDHNELLN